MTVLGQKWHHQILAAGTLGLRSSVPGFQWSYGMAAPPASSEAFEACAVRLTLTVEDELADPGFPGKYHHYSAAEDGDDLYYDRSWAFGSRLQLRLSGLIGGDIHLRVNKAYRRFVTHRFMNLHSPGYILTDIASCELLRRGLAPVHCAAYATEAGATVVLAPPNTGKTMTSIQVCRDNPGASFMAEDLAITDGVTVWAVPWTSTFRYYGSLEGGTRTRLAQRAIALVPPLELLPLVKNKPISDYIEGSSVVHEAPIARVAVLERGVEKVTEEEPEAIAPKAVNLNRFEFHYYKSPTLVAYEYFNPTLDLHAAYEAERRLITKMVQKAPRRTLLVAPSAELYAKLL